MPIINENARIGFIGENIASRYLLIKNYKIIKRNYRNKSGEIDIIGISPDGKLVFFEVKTMKELGELNRLNPEDNLTRQKIEKLILISSMFAAKHQKNINQESGWRIDLLAISIKKEEFVLHHYKNIVGSNN